MNPEIKEKWVKTLRSGEYKQGDNYLAHEGKFCCLGVLSEIAATEGVVTKPKFGSSLIVYGDQEDDTHIPHEVAEWAGIDYYKRDSDPDEDSFYIDGKDSKVINDLMKKNDDGMSFYEIADIIEETL